MTFVSTIFQKNRRFVSFGMAFIVFLLILVSPGQIRQLIGNISNYVFYSLFAEIKNYRYDLGELAEKNRQLQVLVTEYSLQINASAEARRENERLRDFLGFEPPENFRLVPIKILSLESQINPTAAVINKGSDDSLAVNMPVINRFGLVGKIRETMPDHAVVSLLTDPSNAVSGRVAESRHIGIVRYSTRRGMFLDNLPADAEIKKGDLILTSGLGGVYPAGLSVAMVDSAYAERGDIIKTVWLKSTVNFKIIDELYVLKSEQ